MATGIAFFGPLAERTDAVLDQFSPQELATIQRFTVAIADSVHDHVTHLESGPDPEQR